MKSIRTFDDQDLAKLKQVIDSGGLMAGGGMKFVPELERRFAEKMGVRYGVAMNSAMSELHAAVAASGAGAGDEIICDPICHFVGIACMYNNVVPIFADVQKDTYNIDPESVRERVTERTKAIMCTHLWGLPCDMDPIMEIAQKHNLIVVEDCAHALFAQYKGRYAGALGHIGSFSFNMGKHIGTGDGAVATTDDEELRKKMVDISGPTFGSAAHRLAWNYRMTELVAAVALVQLERAERYVEETRACAEIYNEAVRDVEWIVSQRVPQGYKHSYHIWVATFEGAQYGIDYEKFQEAVEEVGCTIGFGYVGGKPAYLWPVFYEPIAYGRGCPVMCPLHEGAAFRQANYQPGSCPNAEEILPKMMLIGVTCGDRAEHQQNAELLRKAIDRFC